MVSVSIRSSAASSASRLTRKRAVISALMTITLHSPGKGARRAFDPAIVQVRWRQES